VILYQYSVYTVREYLLSCHIREYSRSGKNNMSKEKNKVYFVYVLIDPRTDEVAYIGITDDVHGRLLDHLRSSNDSSVKDKWVHRLRNMNLTPIMKVVEVVNARKAAEEREKYWIHYYLSQGVPLTNVRLPTETPDVEVWKNISEPIKLMDTPHSYYVYVLAYPDDYYYDDLRGTVFYIGKGSGKRIDAHEAEAKTGCRCEKCRTIRDIWMNGGQVQRTILYRTNDNDDALTYEKQCIVRYQGPYLTNIKRR